MFMRKRKGQAILEYAILLAVAVAALLIMQAFIKKGYQGGLKASADKMGEQFSAGGTTTKEVAAMTEDQVIVDETATGAAIKTVTEAGDSAGVGDNVYSSSVRTGGDMETTSQAKTDDAKIEKVRGDEYQENAVEDFSIDSN